MFSQSSPCFTSSVFTLWCGAQKQNRDHTWKRWGEAKRQRKILSLSPSSFFDLLSYETLSCGPSSPFVWETRVKGRVFSPFPEKKNAGYYHFSLHNRKQALYEPNQSVVNMVNAAFCAKCETKKKESFSTPLVSRSVIVLFFAHNAEFASTKKERKRTEKRIHKKIWVLQFVGCYMKDWVTALFRPGYQVIMVVNTEVLLRAWTERWSPLQWLVEVKKVAGKDREELQDLAGNFSSTVN